jgi:hypothetical protein
MARRSVAQDWSRLFTMPTFTPGMTWGLGDNSSYEPGPGGPIPDPRGMMIPPPNPIYGRVGALACLRAFGPTIGVWRPWAPIAPYNNAWAPYTPAMYVPGWQKPPATPMSGF